MSQASATGAAAPHSPSERARGIACSIASAAFFAGNTNLARLAFEGGADAATLNAVRFAFTVLVLLLIASMRRRPAALERRQRLLACGLGVLFFLVSFGYMGAIQFIPVSVAVLLLYSYPMLVGLIARLSEREPLGRARAAALVLAFAGLALALGVDAQTPPDWRGVALVILGAVAMALLVTGSSRVMRRADPGTVNLHLMATGAVLFLVALPLGGAQHWPAGQGAWLAFAGAVLVFALAQLSLIAGIRRAGPVLAATLMNLEPLLTIALAVLFLGERLTRLQLLGAALVLAAIFLTSRGRPAPVYPEEP